MIDLHTHTTESDGTLTPVQLVREAVKKGITILGITDHDTFSGYDQAAPYAQTKGIELICGIELSTKFAGESVHLLAYYPEGCPTGSRQWIAKMQASRHERNVRLLERLRECGVPIALEDVQSLGRHMVGRPHFAQVLVKKGYVLDIQNAFDEYLGESARCYVPRDEPQLVESIQRVRADKGIASLAHPVRFQCDLAVVLPKLCQDGLNAIEAYHSDHTKSDTERFLYFAKQYNLLVTGGSDFHGETKPEIELGTGRNKNLMIPLSLVEPLRQ